MKLDKKISIPFWSSSAAREIIKDEIDIFVYRNETYKVKYTEENIIVYTVFILSISGKDEDIIKEFAENVERKLAVL